MLSKIAVFTALAIVLMASSAMAATHVWKTGASGNWSNAANWSAGGVPTSSESGGTIVQLPASVSTTMDISGLVVDEIQFSGSGSSITGTTALGVNGVNLTVNIDDPSGTNTISSPLSVANAAEANVGTGQQLDISNTISGSGGLIKVGAGTLALSGASGNTYSGTTYVQAGVVTLNQTTGVTIPGDVTIGTGGGSAGAATLRELQSSDLPTTANVAVNSDGVFDLNGHTDSINQLTVNGGSVSLGIGTLTTGGALAMTGGSITGASGSVLRLGADVTATSSSTAGAAIAAPVYLDGTRTFTITAGSQSPELTINGVVSNGSVTPSSLVKAGSGTLALTGSASNTYTGGTNVQAGVLTLNQSVGTTIPGNVTIGTGSGAAGSATLRELNSADLPNTANLTVASDGVFDLNGHIDSINQLTVNGGSVTLGAGTLTTGGALAMTGGSISGASGSLLRLGADVTATSSSTAGAAIDAPIALDGARTFTVTSGSQSPELTINGVVSNGTAASSSLAKAGAGTLALSGPTANTYTGATNVQAGVLTLNQTTGATIPSALTIGTGSGSAGSATVRELQSSDLAGTSAVTVKTDGVLDLNGHIDTITSLNIAGGTVKLATAGSQLGILAGGTLSMTGGSIAGPSGHLLLQGSAVNATSSAQGPATISAILDLSGTAAASLAPTFTVAAGSPPELVLSGVVEELSGAHGLVKAGAGTLRITRTNTYTGTTTVNAGTLVADGQQSAPFSVASGGTLTGTGVVGPVTVAGTLTPEVGLRVASLAFSAGGTLNFVIPSTDPSSTPTITSAGAVTIDPAAVLKVVAASGLKVPGGTKFPAITNTSSTAVTGAFSGGPFATPDGVPLVPSYTGGAGNDLVLTAQNVAPAAGPIKASPTSARVGQTMTFSISPSDANHDALTTSWSFGDGATGTGPSTSHAYAAPGTYTVMATVSDGIAQTHASTQVTITSAPVVTGPGQAGTTTTTAYGARLRLSGPTSCVRRGARFVVSLTITSATKAPLTTRLTAAVFTLGHQRVRVHRARYRARLTMPSATKARASVRVRATASLRLRDGKRRRATLSLPVRACR